MDPEDAPTPLLRWAERVLKGWALAVQEYFGLLAQTLRAAASRPFYLRDLIQQADVVGVGSLGIVLLTGLFTGMVLALQSQVELRQFGATIYIGRLVGASTVRELGPVLTALMVTGRAGSGMAAELGAMRVTEQIDALEVMATEPIHYLMVPRVWALVVMLPMLVLLGDAVGIAGGYLVSVVLMGANPVVYMESTFRYMDLWDLVQGLLKGGFFGFLVGVIGCQKGYFTSGGAEGVGRATTRAVVTASIAILVSDFFLTKLLTWLTPLVSG